MDQKSLKKLTDKWYKKLARSGFNDVESTPDYLKYWDSRKFQDKLTPAVFEAHQRYFELASQLLHDASVWETKQDKRIWEGHCQGHTLTVIAKRVSRSVEYVRYKIAYYAKYIKS